MGEGAYVVGMEPGEEKEFNLEIGVLSGKEAIDKFKTKVEAN